jgi:uncharacterized protein (TIGR03000 family)
MRMLGHNRIFQAAAVAAGIVAFSAADALAWGHRHGSSGSYGSSGSSGSSASYGSGSSSSYASYASSSSSSYGSYGSSGSSASAGSSSSGGRPGLFARWHARKAAKHSSGSSASYGTYAYSSSGSSASYGSSSSGSSASYGGYAAPSGVYDQGVPVEYDYSTPADAPVETQPAVPAVDAAAAIRVTLPTDAVVFVNDRPTTSMGAERSYVSRGLVGGRTYAYELRVEFTREGEKVVENKTVRLKAGESIDLSFGDGEQVAANAESTDLTLHVPAGAKVTLAGAPTKQTGETRTYSTTTLAPGQEWDGYVVRVELQRDGKTLVEEKTLSIVGGENYEFSFDFAQEAAQVASLN